MPIFHALHVAEPSGAIIELSQPCHYPTSWLQTIGQSFPNLKTWWMKLWKMRCTFRYTVKYGRTNIVSLMPRQLKRLWKYKACSTSQHHVPIDEGGGAAITLISSSPFLLTKLDPITNSKEQNLEVCWGLLKPRNPTGQIKALIICAFYLPPFSKSVK